MATRSGSTGETAKAPPLDVRPRSARFPLTQVLAAEAASLRDEHICRREKTRENSSWLMLVPRNQGVARGGVGGGLAVEPYIEEEKTVGLHDRSRASLSTATS
jgi:hypothetical protein